MNFQATLIENSVVWTVDYLANNEFHLRELVSLTEPFAQLVAWRVIPAPQPDGYIFGHPVFLPRAYGRVIPTKAVR